MASSSSILKRILFGIGFCGFLIFIWPIVIFRFILSSILAPLFRPDLGSALLPQSSFLYFPATNSTFNIIIKFRLRGKLDLEALAKHITERCILSKNAAGEFLYPEFQKFTTLWLGYPFWKNEISFKMEQHMRHVTLNLENEVHGETNRILQLPFPSNLSPWEITFLETNENPNAYHICFKFNHTLADGASIFNCFMGATDAAVEQLQPQQPHLSFYQRTQAGINAIISFFRILHQKEPETDSAVWKDSLTGRRYTAISDPIALADIRKLKNNLRVTVSTILLSLITGAIRRKFIQDQVIAPKLLKTSLPIFVPDHPKTLRNKIFAVILDLPIGLPDARQRVFSIQNQIQREYKRNSSTPIYFLNIVFGLLPKWMSPKPDLVPRPLNMSIFPGPTSSISVMGNMIEDMAFVMCGGEEAYIVTNLMSYNGQIRIWINADEKLCPSQEAADVFTLFLRNELEDLKLAGSEGAVYTDTKLEGCQA